MVSSMLKSSRSYRVFTVINYILLTLFTLMFCLPYLMIVSASFSDELTLIREGYSLIPQGLSVAAYRYIFTENTLIFTSIWNSVKLTVIGSALTLIVSGMYAYPLSRPYIRFKKIFNIFMIIPMLFSGGLIPYYLTVTSVFGGILYDSIWAIILPGCFAIWYAILMRNYFLSLPDSLEEAAKIDGASDVTVLIRIILPLSKPIIATILLYSAVSLWSNWYGALLFIRTPERYPLQFFIQQVMANVNSLYPTSSSTLQPSETLKMACVVVSTLPIIIIYPFVQKYFVQGTTLGSVKE